MLLGYNTNGFAHHRLSDAIAILAELGYQSVAITLDFHALNPFADDLYPQILKVRRQLERLKLRCVVETGARFLLDPRRKHQPTLISPAAEERQRRLDFLLRSIDVATELGADAVSFWSGSASDDATPKMLMQRLADGVARLCEHAEVRKVRLAFEPEPGMFIDTMVRR
jgi:sugar phosphate isomerase/epimerase